MTSSGGSGRGRLTAGLATFATAYGLETALLLFFVVQAFRHLWMADDGYIYLVYVRNLTENHAGAVFNTGQHVEGYTSVGWFALLSILNWLRPPAFLDLRKMTVVLSILVSVGALSLWPVIERRAAGRAHRDRRPTANIPLAVLVATFAVYSFATSGLETPLEYLFLSLMVWYVYQPNERFEFALLLVAFAPLVRPDYVLFSVVLFGRYVRRGGRRPVVLLLGAVIPSAIVLVLRIWYYAALFPNTYYAKTNTGFGLHAGLVYLREFVMSYGAQWVFFGAVVVMVAFALQRTTEAKASYLRPLRDERQFLFLSALVYGVYVLSVGGDFMAGRMWLPVFFPLVGIFAGVGTKAVEMLRSPSPGLQRLVAVALVVGVALVAVTGEPVANAMSRYKSAEFNGIDNQERAIERQSPNVHNLFGAYEGTWGLEGDAIRALSAKLGTEIGVSKGPIGEIAYQGRHHRGDVYVFDQLGLTNLAGAHIDMRGEERRIGHAKTAPLVLADNDPRVDFAPQYFRRYSRVFVVKFDGWSAPLINLDLLPELVKKGIVTAADAGGMREWIMHALSQPIVDRNLVYFLSTHYHAPDAIGARIAQLAPLGRQSRWARWLNEYHHELELLAPAPPRGSFFHRLSVAIHRHRAHPIDYLPPGPDEVANPFA